MKGLGCSKRSENIINLKIGYFCIDAMSIFFVMETTVNISDVDHQLKHLLYYCTFIFAPVGVVEVTRLAMPWKVNTFTTAKVPVSICLTTRASA